MLIKLLGSTTGLKFCELSEILHLSKSSSRSMKYPLSARWPFSIQGQSWRIFSSDSCSLHILEVGRGMEYVVIGSVMSTLWASMTWPAMISLIL